jgi:transposase-like protein
MYKSDLAKKAGVSRNTLMNWCKPHMKELRRLGLKPHSKVLPPKVVQFIAETFDIDL